MNTKYLNTLEYNKIIEILKNYCKTYIGKKYLLELLPVFDYNLVCNLLNETTEAVSLINRKSDIPLSEIPDISLWIKHLKSNLTLSIKSIYEIANFLKISRQLKDYFYFDKDFDLSSFPILSEYFSGIYINKGLEEKILSIILDENNISDNASSKLLKIRKQIKKSELEIRDKLNSFIHSPSYSKYIMEPIITIRNNRFVVPIKEEYKTQVKGFIHDISNKRFYCFY